METLSIFLKNNPGFVYHIGTNSMSGWVMVGTKTELSRKEQSRVNSENYFSEASEEKRKREIADYCLIGSYDRAITRINAHKKNSKKHQRTIRAIPRYADWCNRQVLDSWTMMQPGHIAIIVEGKEKGKYWDQEEYQNETPREDI